MRTSVLDRSIAHWSDRPCGGRRRRGRSPRGRRSGPVRAPSPHGRRPPARRRAASLADRAGPVGRRRAAADRQPDRRHRLAGRYGGRAGARTRSRPARSRRAWRCRATADAGSVTHWYGYDLAVLDIKDDRIAVAGRVEVGPEPRGVAIVGRRRDGLSWPSGVSNEVVRVDLDAPEGHRPAGRRPRAARAWRSRPTGRGSLVGNARSQDVSVIDARTWTVERTIPIDGDNLRQVAVGRRRQDGLRRQHEEPRVRHDRATTSTWAGCSASG